MLLRWANEPERDEKRVQLKNAEHQYEFHQLLNMFRKFEKIRWTALFTIHATHHSKQKVDLDSITPSKVIFHLRLLKNGNRVLTAGFN